MRRVAILHPGELGAALAARLSSQRIECRAVLTGRSGATRCRAEAAGMTICRDLAEALAGAVLIVSVVPAHAAEAVAEQVSTALAPTRGKGVTVAKPPGNLEATAEHLDVASSGGYSARPLVYLDANSLAPQVLERIATTLAGIDVACVDGALIGPANRLDRDATLLLSGPDAEGIAALLSPAVRARVVGAKVGQASALKLSLSVVTKGLVALAVEALAAARAAGAEEHAAALLESQYPGVWEVARRALPTYPRHARRRHIEMADAADWMESEGLQAPMTRAAAAAFAQIAAAGLDPDRDWTIETVVQALAGRG